MFGTEYSMRIWLDASKLHSYNLAPSDDQGNRAQNVCAATGEPRPESACTRPADNAVVPVRSRLSTPEEFGKHPGQDQTDGSAVRAQGLSPASVWVPRATTSSARLDGEPVATVAIRVKPRTATRGRGWRRARAWWN